MECTIAALVACFSWSNLYVDTGLLAQDRGQQWELRQLESFSNRATPSGAIESGTEVVTYKGDDNQNPYGRVAIGYEVEIAKSLVVRFEGSHVSSIATKDRGVNSLGLYARWRPFAR